jgi:hypothetical protein
MQIDKQKIVDVLMSQGKHAQAQQANNQLPGKVDTDQHAALLSKPGINPRDLVSKVGGDIGGMFK